VHGGSGGVRRVLRAQVAVGCALALMGASAIGVGAAQSNGVLAARGGASILAQGGAVQDPLQLFEPMMPVLTHERCSNCHGGVDVFSDQSHGGGALEKSEVPLNGKGDMLPGQDGNTTCTKSGCHDENAANSVWRLAPKQMSFVGKDALTLCKQMRQENGLATGDPAAFDAFKRHIENDQLIGFAFEGYRAQLDNMPDPATGQKDDAEPPPMQRPEFLQLASRWLDEGHARCGPWTGTIVETVHQSITGGGAEQVLDFQIDIAVDGGEAKAHVTGSGYTQSRGPGCQLRRDDVSIDQKDVPVDLHIIMANDLAVPGFQVPSLPSPSQIVPPGVNVPSNVPSPFTQDTYSMILTLPPMQGIDHWEQHDNTIQGGCTTTRGDLPFIPSLGGTTIAKPLDPNDKDHLHDTDTQQAGQDTITLDWDLSRI
jgi:hypothetical protein